MFLTPSKQVTSRFFVAEFILSIAEGLLRMTLRKVPRATGDKPTIPTFEGDTKLRDSRISISKSFGRCVIKDYKD